MTRLDYAYVLWSGHAYLSRQNVWTLKMKQKQIKHGLTYLIKRMLINPCPAE